MNHKQLLIGVSLILFTFMSVFIVAKEIVMPVYGEYEQVQTDLLTLTKAYKINVAQLEHVKNIVRKEC